jgi:hypothetical protein
LVDVTDAGNFSWTTVFSEAEGSDALMGRFQDDRVDCK